MDLYIIIIASFLRVSSHVQQYGLSICVNNNLLDICMNIDCPTLGHIGGESRDVKVMATIACAP